MSPFIIHLTDEELNCLNTPQYDAMAFDDNVVSLDDMECEAVSPLNRAGMDDLTPVDTFINANGDYIFITEDCNGERSYKSPES
jgi:hypothetical protein